MGGKVDDKVKKILQLQEKNTKTEDIAEMLNFPSIQALRSFMNRKGFKSNKGIFQPKDEESNNTDTYKQKEVKSSEKQTTNKNKKETKTNEINPNVEMVLDLQIYNVPLLKISKMINMKDYEIDKMMDEHGYIRTGEKFVTKPKPIKSKPEKKKKATSKKKEKTKKQLLEEEYKKNPAKRGTFDPINQVWVINVQLVEILDLQLKKVSLGNIAKQMKMTKPGLIEFMEEKGYVLENDKFIQRKLAKKVDIDIEENITTIELKPRVYDDRKENVEFTEESFKDIQNDIQNMFNWYKNIKEHQIFETLKNSDMEK